MYRYGLIYQKIPIVTYIGATNYFPLVHEVTYLG
jgi:hypothetical protein